jgi:zinc protease
VERIQLPNGLVLLLSENHSVPAVSINAIVLAGSRLEPDDKAGLASLTGELIAEGTATRTSQQIAETVESVGGRIGTFGQYETSGAALSILSKDIHLGLDIAADVLINPAFPEDKVIKQIERRIAQLRSRLDVPRTQASDEFNKIIFKGTPRHRPSVGYENTVKNITRDDIIGFHKRYYLPNNTLLAIVGDFQIADVIKLVEETFGKWKPDPDFRASDVVVPLRQKETVEKFVHAPKEQVNIFIGHLGVERNNADYYALLVMDTILGSSPGFTSRIPRVLRDEQGLAYTTFSNVTSSAGIDPGRFIAYIGTSPENLDRAVAGLRHEIRRIVEEPVTQDELEGAKAYLTGNFVFDFQTNAQIASFLIEAEIYSLGFDYLQTYPKLIRAITIEEISEVARKHIDPHCLTTVVVGPVDESGQVITKE